jgi:hypothetical protein
MKPGSMALDAIVKFADDFKRRGSVLTDNDYADSSDDQDDSDDGDAMHEGSASDLFFDDPNMRRVAPQHYHASSASAFPHDVYGAPARDDGRYNNNDLPPPPHNPVPNVGSRASVFDFIKVVPDEKGRPTIVREVSRKSLIDRRQQLSLHQIARTREQMEAGMMTDESSGQSSEAKTSWGGKRHPSKPQKRRGLEQKALDFKQTNGDPDSINLESMSF